MSSSDTSRDKIPNNPINDKMRSIRERIVTAIIMSRGKSLAEVQQILILRKPTQAWTETLPRS